MTNYEKNNREHRKIGLNPVDKVITLITHKKNESLIFNITKEGLVPIRSSFVENSFLENIVVSDTPGTGDPILTGDIARDFLPICDLIIYFFSATNPLDTADQPLLDEKFSSLHFIPTKFVVTRADEFRKDGESLLDENNFDAAKANAFLGAFTQRVNQLFRRHNVNISAEDIFLVDNKAGFGVKELKDYIVNFSDISNVEGQVRIHSHKVLYFRNTAKILRDFFSSFLDDKVIALTSFVGSARQNIERFNDAMHISNNFLTESWTDSYGEIQSNYYLLNSSLPDELDLPSSSLGFDQYAREKALYSLKGEIRESSKKVIKDYIDKRKKDISFVFMSKTSELKRKINSSDIKDLADESKEFIIRISDIDIKKFSKEKPSLKISSVVISKSKDFVDELNGHINEASQKIGERVLLLKTKLSEQEPLPSYDDIMTKSEKTLSNDFDKFFEIITIYRSGVFSYNVRETIEKLGLGQKLDNLENTDFSAVEKDSMKQEARETIYPGRMRIFSEFKRENIGLEAEAAKILKDFENFLQGKSSFPRSSFKMEENDLEVVQTDIENYMLLQVNKLQQGINSSLLSTRNSIIERWEEEVITKSRDRKRYFLAVMSSSGFLGLCSYFAYIRFRDIDVSGDIFSNIALALLSNAIFSGLGFLTAKAFDRYPRKIQIAKSRLLEVFRKESFELIDTEISGFLPKESSETLYFSVAKNDDEINRSVNFLTLQWTRNLIEEPIDRWCQAVSPHFDKLVEINKSYQEVRQRYVEVVENFSEDISCYFSDVQSNLDKLRDYSNALKRKSVDPSFDLLASTRDTLQDLKEKIDDVEFE